jgi:putative ATP-dependent endonuclease of OLD family
VLSPRFSVSLNDADFHNCQPADGLRIEATISDVPEDLLDLRRYGHLTCGLAAGGDVIESPADGSEICLALRFSTDSSLEPLWEVFKPGSDQTKQISANARASLGLFRIDDRVDMHLRWGRGSALTALSGGQLAASEAVANTYRQARQTIFGAPDESLVTATETVLTELTHFGAGRYVNLRPGLDPASQTTSHGLVLHDGDVPITSQGLGMRRLTSIAIQHARAGHSSLILVDEVEHGLEPHRLYHLLRRLQERSEAGDAQVVMTTHSPLVVQSLAVTKLAVVRSAGSVTSVRSVPQGLQDEEVSALQGTVRKGPSAMLASRVAVVEGPTELGLMRALTEYWEKTESEPVAIVGTQFKDGKGDFGTLVSAKQLADLGYPTAALLDSDKPLATESQAARAAGGLVVRWAGGVALEERLALDLPEAALKEFVELAVEVRGDDEGSLTAVLDAITARLPDDVRTPTLIGADPLTWITAARTLEVIRHAVGSAAAGRNVVRTRKENEKSWFKDETRGMQLGALVAKHLPAMADTDTFAKLTMMRQFVFASVPTVHDEADRAVSDV